MNWENSKSVGVQDTLNKIKLSGKNIAIFKLDTTKSNDEILDEIYYFE